MHHPSRPASKHRAVRVSECTRSSRRKRLIPRWSLCSCTGASFPLPHLLGYLRSDDCLNDLRLPKHASSFRAGYDAQNHAPHRCFQRRSLLLARSIYPGSRLTQKSRPSLQTNKRRSVMGNDRRGPRALSTAASSGTRSLTEAARLLASTTLHRPLDSPTEGASRCAHRRLAIIPHAAR